MPVAVDLVGVVDEGQPARAQAGQQMPEHAQRVQGVLEHVGEHHGVEAPVDGGGVDAQPRGSAVAVGLARQPDDAQPPRRAVLGAPAQVAEQGRARLGERALHLGEGQRERAEARGAAAVVEHVEGPIRLDRRLQGSQPLAVQAELVVLTRHALEAGDLLRVALSSVRVGERSSSVDLLLRGGGIGTDVGLPRRVGVIGADAALGVQASSSPSGVSARRDGCLSGMP